MCGNVTDLKVRPGRSQDISKEGCERVGEFLSTESFIRLSHFSIININCLNSRKRNLNDKYGGLMGAGDGNAGALKGYGIN